MNDFKELKNSDFGYGNELPEFLNFLDKKQSYWNILFQKLINDTGRNKELMEYIHASQQPFENDNNYKRKSRMFLNDSGLGPTRHHSSMSYSRFKNFTLVTSLTQLGCIYIINTHLAKNGPKLPKLPMSNKSISVTKRRTMILKVNFVNFRKITKNIERVY